MVALIAAPEVVAAAQEIDAAFWPVGAQVARGWTTDADWFTLREGNEASIASSSTSPASTWPRRAAASPPARSSQER